jgi:hypothetical protein
MGPIQCFYPDNNLSRLEQKLGLPCHLCAIMNMKINPTYTYFSYYINPCLWWDVHFQFNDSIPTIPDLTKVFWNLFFCLPNRNSLTSILLKRFNKHHQVVFENWFLLMYYLYLLRAITHYALFGRCSVF